MRQAGSTDAFRAVDLDMVAAFARAAATAGARRMVTVSSVGADSGSANFYLRIKGEMEAALEALGFERLDILRPGLLRGPRGGDRRPGERIAIALSPLVNLFLRGRFDRFAAIDADRVAAAIAGALRQSEPGTRRHDNRSIRRWRGRSRREGREPALPSNRRRHRLSPALLEIRTHRDPLRPLRRASRRHPRRSRRRGRSAVRARSQGGGGRAAARSVARRSRHQRGDGARQGRRDQSARAGRAGRAEAGGAGRGGERRGRGAGLHQHPSLRQTSGTTSFETILADGAAYGRSTVGAGGGSMSNMSRPIRPGRCTWAIAEAPSSATRWPACSNMPAMPSPANIMSTTPARQVDVLARSAHLRYREALGAADRRDSRRPLSRRLSEAGRRGARRRVWRPLRGRAGRANGWARSARGRSRRCST